eukprot:gene36399-57523_t
MVVFSVGGKQMHDAEELGRALSRAQCCDCFDLVVSEPRKRKPGVAPRPGARSGATPDGGEGGGLVGGDGPGTPVKDPFVVLQQPMNSGVVLASAWNCQPSPMWTALWGVDGFICWILKDDLPRRRDRGARCPR